MIPSVMQLSDPPRTQKEVNEHIARHVPTHAWQSTVAIVAAQRPLVGQIGTGTLFQIADVQFIITAGHVIREANNRRLGIGLAATGTPNLIPLTTEWLCTVPGANEPSDLYDIAVNRIPPTVAAKLEAKRFLRTTDISDAGPGPKAVYSLFGYPGMWSRPSRAAAEDVIVKPLEFTTYAHDGDVAALTGYEARLHLLLAASPEYITAPDGTSLEVRDRLGQPAVFPRALRGVSGCSVWHIGDLGVPIERWGDHPAYAVGIETAIYQHAGVVKVSRWTVATTLIHDAFPELRPALQLWRACPMRASSNECTR